MIDEESFMLKVFINKANGQLRVHLPKRALSKIPEKVNVSIPKQCIKKIKLRSKWF